MGHNIIYINALNYYEVKKWAAKEQEADLTYTKVMDKCKEYEATVRDYVAMANDNSQLQTAYQQGTASLDHNSLKKQKFTGRGRRNRSNSGSRERRPQNKPNGTKCKRCGFERHTTTDGSCPALKSTCGFCKIVGHYESACIKKRTEKKREGTDKRGKQTHSPNRGKRAQTPGPASRRAAVPAIRTTDQLQHDFDRIHFDSISTVYPTAPKVNIDTLTTMDTATDGKTYVLTDLDVKLPTRPQRDTMRVKLDMGAEANILPVRTYNKMFPDRVLEDGTPDPKYLQPTHIEFECNKDSIIRSLGCINLDIAAPGKKLINSQLFVSSHHNQILIGHPSCDRLGAYTLHMQNKAPPFDQNKLLPQLSEVNQTGTTEGRITSVADLMKRYPKQFDVIGKFEGEYHMVTDPNVPPSQHAMRKIPIEYQEKIEKELDRMEEQGIITKVTEPTEWVNSITYPVKPNGDLRICLDPKDLNKAINREHYKAPTLEEITHKLCGATKFSKVDCYKGFFAYLMDKASSMKTTFNTIPRRGRYRYLRVPMGAKFSQDAYQMKMDQILEGLPGVIAIHDDITIFGKSDDDHDTNLIGLMECAKETGLTLNSKNCSIGQDSVSFFGVIFGKDGMCPDPKKIQGILEMPPPKDTTQLQSFLGMVNFMHNFIPHLSEHTATLRGLLTKNAIFHWDESTNAAFQKLKSLIAEAQKRSLKFYNRNLPLTVQADASKHGLGAALLQQGEPVAFASKSLSETEQRYANIERELLAVVFPCERFKTYVLSRDFTVESDHKPLEMIALKNLVAAPPRLQRMLLRLQHFNCTIKYRPGKEMLLADALSRLPSPANTTIELDMRIDHHGFTTERIKQISVETATDPILAIVHNFTQDGWPTRRNRVPRIARQYWDQWDELSTDRGLLMKGPRIVIPGCQRERTLNNLHTGHKGTTAMSQIAKNTVYWPGIDADIEDFVHRCPTCLVTKPNNKWEPLLPHTVPDGPWQKVGADYFDFDGTKYLLLIDYFSKFIYVEEMCTTTAKSTIKKLKTIFSIEGSPNIFFSDNAVFNSAEFQQFSQDWNFEHITSSPNYPQSNGQAERAVQTIKQRMARCKKDGSDWQQALQELRSTPTKDLPSPAEILHGRPARTVNGQAPAYPVNMDEVKQKLELKQEQYAQNYNRRHRVTPLAPLHLQQSVLIQHHSGNWEPATIQQIGPEPRSYLCTTNSGKVFRRNRRQIRETGLPDQKDKLQPSTTTTAAKKSVRWSDDVYITVDAESAYSLATQGI